MTSIAQKLKLVAHELAFLAQILMSQLTGGDKGSSKDGVDNSVDDVRSSHDANCSSRTDVQVQKVKLVAHWVAP